MIDPIAATAALLDSVPPEVRARSDAYFEGGYWLQLWGFLLGGAIALFLLHSGWSVRMRSFAERLTSVRPLQVGLYWLQYLGATALLGFPLSLYAGFVREHQYDLATQTFGAWFVDELKAFGLAAVLGGLALMGLYRVFRSFARTWWVWGSAFVVMLAAVGSLIFPVFIAPVFNTYTPLDDPRVQEPILQLAQANGITADTIYQVDASRQSTRISANVSGLAGTLRITLNDNLLKRCTLEEVKAVMAHEMGHYALNHVYEGLLFETLFILSGFAFVRLAFEWARTRCPRWGIRGIDDPAGLPLLVLLLTVYGFALTPVQNTFIRVNEAEADLFGLNAAREPDGFATVALKLGEYRKLSPSPFEEALLFDHPSGRSRILMAMTWKSHQGTPSAQGARVHGVHGVHGVHRVHGVHERMANSQQQITNSE
jgi:STE24 endopeptidase